MTMVTMTTSYHNINIPFTASRHKYLAGIAGTTVQYHFFTDSLTNLNIIMRSYRSRCQCIFLITGYNLKMQVYELVFICKMALGQFSKLHLPTEST